MPRSIPTFRASALFALAVAGICPAAARARTALLDFEGQATAAPGSLSTLTVNDAALRATITRLSGGFGVGDLSADSGTVSFGARSLVTDAGAAPITVNFSEPLDSFSAALGDFGGVANTLSLRAFSGLDGGGAPLGGDTQTLVPVVNDTFNFRTLYVQASGIRSVQLSGLANGVNGVFYDNFGATTANGGNAIPLPPAGWAGLATLLGLAGVSSVVRQREKRRA